MIFLGIDGGGSKTAFLLEDTQGNELARLETGPSNWISSGADHARESISRGIMGLPSLPDVVCGGFAGAGRPEGIEFYRNCLTHLVPKSTLFIEIDAHIAYIGAIGLKAGLLVMAGTGSIVITRNAHGAFFRTGGWGPNFSDEGSGFWIGREAVRSALRAHDVGESREFVSEITQALGLTQITEVQAAWKDGLINVRSVASLATRIFEQFPEEPAKRILSEAGAHLHVLAEAARHRAELPETCLRSISGSIGSNPTMQRLIGLPFSPPLHDPVQGAILWARDRIRAS